MKNYAVVDHYSNLNYIYYVHVRTKSRKYVVDEYGLCDLGFLDEMFPMRGYSESRKIINKLELKFVSNLFKKFNLEQIIKSSPFYLE